VAWHLLKAGYTVELDAWDWAAGENFVARMHHAVDAADRVVALFSPAYFEDGRYTADEWSSALVKDEQGGHRLVPMQVERCVLPRLLRPLVRAELFGVDEQEAERRLLEAVRGPQPPDGVPAFPGGGGAGVSTSRGEGGPRLPGAMPPVWNVGPRNARFVGRGAALASVAERLRSGEVAVVQALHGMGGVGKSQLAIEYAHRHAGSYDVVWWVNAEETGLIGEQFAALAAELGLTGPRADTATAVGALRAYLRGHGRWLLVFDNAESPRELRDWLPVGPGHTLITSRNPGWGELASRVEVDVLSRPESTALIRSHRPGVGEAEADRLAEALGDLPLALAQAAGFLAETGMPAGDYSDLLGDRAGELLGESPPDAHPLSLAAAIWLSTDRLAQVDPAALGMLRVGAFLAPEPIPADVLTGRVPASGACPPEVAALAGVVASPVAAHRSLGRIGRYGLARVEGGLHLHRLTQAVLRDQLPAGQASACRAYAAALLVAADPGDERDAATWPGWARMLPHLLAADPATSTSPDLRDLACRAAWYLGNRGESHTARDFADHLRRTWRERLGPDDPHALRIAALLARILVDIGPYQEARRLGEEALARSRRVLGDDHPDTLQAANHLAKCLHELGAFEQSRLLNEDTLARRRRLFGDDHIVSWRTAAYLARDLRALGEVEEARRLHEGVLAHRRRVFGDVHPATLNAAVELGASLRLAGEAEAARRLHEDTLALARRVLGEDHFWTMDCVKELVSDLHALGAFEAARRLSEDTFARARRVLGEESHFTIDAANILAASLHALGEYEAARKLSDDTLRLARRVLGDEHPHTRRAAENLAAAQRALGGDENSS
jgi:tetratricopeptide (TPR) repeat protein